MERLQLKLPSNNRARRHANENANRTRLQRKCASETTTSVRSSVASDLVVLALMTEYE
ncbi:unnamed protein product [Cylicocyclus nassatus]|uniref:Uncharacterized protein n=1 Tax=Cylicocyclus nassatus TaxID=53992 RepID=A0AA36H2S1_CYLNA|nr:unnamed protein product [Cylicocyclus nassatus]